MAADAALSKLSDKELTKLGYDLGRDHDELRAQRLAVKAEQNDRHAAAAAQALLDDLTDDQRAAVAAALKE